MTAYRAKWHSRDGQRGTYVVMAQHSCDVVLHVMRLLGERLRSVSVSPCDRPTPTGTAPTSPTEPRRA